MSDHFDGERFCNRYGPTIDRGLRDALRWRRQRGGVAWPAPVRFIVADTPPRRSEALRVVLIGHASLLIQVAGCNILVDPVWSERASPLSFAGPRRHTPPGVAFDDLPPIDAVLITHSHYDHMDAPTLARLWARDRPLVIAPLGNDVVLQRVVPGIAVSTADWGERIALAPGVVVTLTPANHWSSRSLTDRRRALWCGYALRTPHGLVYLAGDTGYGNGRLFEQMRRVHGAPDLAVLPIGAYEPRWFMSNQHMNPAEAVQAFRALGAKQARGVHWGCFRMTDEARDAPLAALAAARTANGIPPERFSAMHAGEVWRN